MDARVGLPLHSCARVCLCVIAGAGLCVLQAPGPEYKKLDTDLNKGSAGHFVYLCYKKGCAKKPSSPPSPLPHHHAANGRTCSCECHGYACRIARKSLPARQRALKCSDGGAFTRAGGVSRH